MPSSKVIVVGDYKYDVECGKAAGSKTVLLVDTEEVPDWGRGADYFIRESVPMSLSSTVIRPCVTS